MRIFLSWSGQSSQQMAAVLKSWLPSVIQFTEPYMSSEDIDKGVAWFQNIQSMLSESDFGIICVTKENQNRPWVSFEAGALSKHLGSSRVCPILIDLKPSDISSPLAQFQATEINNKDIFKLVKTINSSSSGKQLSESQLEKVYGVWWPHLEKELTTIKSNKNTLPW